MEKEKKSPADILDAITKKYNALGQDPANALKGFSHTKPVTYWDYTEVDTLLSLQRPRTDYPDEPIFIMYHQVTELLLKLIVHELQQVVGEQNISPQFFRTKIDRVNRYAGILTQSFSVMREGMDYEQYNEFRLALAPASGFQSAQFRVIELMCTDILNLLNSRMKGKLKEDAGIDKIFEELYWKDAGLDRATGKKSQMLKLFEEKYQPGLKKLAAEMKDKNVLQRFLSVSEKDKDHEALKNALRNFDHTYNVLWPLAHLKTAEYYLNSKGEGKAATGGSEWQKYLHPSYQRRIFFPQLWTKDELEKWGTF